MRINLLKKIVGYRGVKTKICNLLRRTEANNMMKEREFLEKLCRLTESSAKIDISRGVMLAIEFNTKKKILLTSFALFPLFLLASLECAKLISQSKRLIIFIDFFNIAPLIKNHPFASVIFSIIILSFAASFAVSFIIQGGEKNELLLSPR